MLRQRKRIGVIGFGSLGTCTERDGHLNVISIRYCCCQSSLHIIASLSYQMRVAKLGTQATVSGESRNCEVVELSIASAEREPVNGQSPPHQGSRLLMPG